jgi:hypothetical protein
MLCDVLNVVYQLWLFGDFLCCLSILWCLSWH